MVLALGKYDFFSKQKHCALKTSMMRPRYTTYWIKQNTAPWCLFDSTTREIGSTNVVLAHLPLEAIGKELDEEEAQFSCFDGSYIRGFSNAWYQSYGKTQWRDPLNGVW